MSNTFNLVGTLSLPKETEKFKPYTQRTSASGWQMDELRFNVTCGDNRHMLNVKAGYWKDGHGDIFSFTKGGVDDNGNRIKGESIKIPFKDRLTSPLLAEVAEFKKFIFDSDDKSRRNMMKAAMDKIKEGKEIPEEDLKKMGVATEAEIPVEYEKSVKKRKEFISEKDYLEHIQKVINSGKYTDKLFYVTGEIKNEMNPNNGQFYTKYVPTRIYLAADDTEVQSMAEFRICYDKDSLDGLSVGEKHEYYINGYTFEYNPETKKNDLPCPVTLTLPVPDESDEMATKMMKKFLRYFTVTDDTVKELGVKCLMLNGAQKKSLTVEDLDSEMAENLELGLITWNDIYRELGVSNTYGDKIQAYVVTGLMSGFAKGAQDTVYSSEDFIVKAAEPEVAASEDEVNDILEGMSEDEDDDI